MNLEEIITRWRKKYFQWILLFNLVLFFSLVASLLVVLSVLIYWRMFFPRFLLFPAVVIITILVGLNFYKQKRWLRKSWLKYLAELVGQKHPDEIINARSLKAIAGSDDLTGALARAFRQQVSSNLIKFSPDFSNLKKKIFYLSLPLLVFFCWLIFPPQIIANFRRWCWGRVEEIFRIYPGDSRIDYGGEQEIIITRISPEFSPLIFVKTNHQNWQKIRPQQMSENTFNYTIKNITEEIWYYVFAGGWRTRNFHLQVVFPPQVAFSEVEYYYPEYTGEGKQVSHRALIRAIPYTRVVWKMYSSQQLKSVILVTTEKKYPAQLSTDGIRFSAEMILKQNDTYYFQLETPDGRTYSTESYNIEIIPDIAPAVEITVPAQDLRADRRDSVLLVARLEDDFGVNSVELVWRVNSGEWGVIPVKKFSPPAKSELLITEIKLREFNLQPHDHLEYYLRATDNSPEKKFGRSLTYEIEIAGYSEQHQEIGEKLKEWQEDLIKQTARESLLVDDLHTALGSTIAVSNQQFSLWKQQQEGINEQIEKLISDLAELLQQMATDPLNDFYTYTEFQAIKNNLTNLKENNLSRGTKNLEENKLPSAHQELSAALSMLERMAVFSEDVQQYQQWRGLLDRTDDSLKLLDSIQENLAATPNRDKIMKELKEIEKLVQEIEQLLANAPQKLPEEFVNQPAIKELNFADEKDLLKQLNEQISRGDFSSVENLLKQLRQQLSDLKETFARSGENIQLRDSSGKTLQKYQKLNQQLATIIQQQTRLLNITSDMENQRQSFLFRQQELALKTGTTTHLSRIANDFLKDNEKQLKEFTAQQEEILNQTRDFYTELNDFARQTATLPMEALGNISDALKYQKTSRDSLIIGETGESVVAQGQALQKLQDASQMLNEAQRQYASGQAGAGQKTAGSLQQKLSGTGGLSGKTGIRVEPVRLPRPEDFRPPQEFRQEILDALKEKYPADYEKNIKEYYQRLLQQ